LGSDGREPRGGVRDTGDGSIEISFQYRSQRVRERLALDPSDTSNMNRARRLRAAILEAIGRGKFTFREYLPQSRHAQKELDSIDAAKSLTLAQAFERAIATLPHLQPETRATYVRESRAWQDAKMLGADTAVETITVADIKAALAKLTISRKRIRNFLIPLRHAFDHACDAGKIKSNPVDSIKVKKLPRDHEIDQEREIPFTVKEVDRLAKADPYSGHIWKLWAATGCRGQELNGLMWSDIKRDGIHIRRAIRTGRAKSTKTPSGLRVIQISPQAQEALGALKKHTGHQEYVILNPNTQKRFHGDRPLRHCFIRDCSTIGLPYKEPKFLRHSFASWHLEAGESPAWIARQMGHKTVEEVLRTYARHIPRNLDNHGSRLQAALKAGRDLGLGFEETI
jgi:integrase